MALPGGSLRLCQKSKFDPGKRAVSSFRKREIGEKRKSPYRTGSSVRQETNYAAFVGRIAEEIPQDATICIAGYPCAYWGLIGLDRGYHLLDETFLSDSLGVDVLNKAGWFVVVNGLSPEDDAPDVQSQIDLMKHYAVKAGKTSILKDFIGERRRFAYTARVFRLLPNLAPAPKSRALGNEASGGH